MTIFTENFESDVLGPLSLHIGQQLLPQIYALRWEVFVVEQGFSYDLDVNDLDCFHVSLNRNGETVAAARLFTFDNIAIKKLLPTLNKLSYRLIQSLIDESDSFLFLGRLAVRSSFRKNGLGSLVVRECCNFAKVYGSRFVFLHAQQQVAGFYSKIGFKIASDLEIEDNCPHIWMYKELF